MGQLLALSTVAIGIRAARFGAIAGRSAISFWRPTAGYSLACLLVPGGIGELTLPIYLKPYGVTALQGLAALITTRLAAIALSVILMAIWMPAFLQTSWIRIGLIMLLSIVLLAILIGVLRNLSAKRIVLWALPALARMQKSLAEVMKMGRRFSWQVLLRIAILTVLWKLLNALIYWQLARSINLGLGFHQVFGAMLMYSLFMVLPIPSLAGFGTSETWWILSLKAEGLNAPHAALAALTFHVGNFFLLTLIGSWPMIKPLLHERTSFSHPPQMNDQKE